MSGRLSQFAGAYREWAPAPELREHVRCLWVNDLSDSAVNLIQVVPDGCVDIIWSKRGFRVAGPDTRPVLEQLQRHESVAGARFHPGTAYPWFGVPLTALLNARVPLAEFWKDGAECLSEDSLEACDAVAVARRIELALLARLPRVGPADRGIAFLRKTASDYGEYIPLGMPGLAGRIGVSERTLRRDCLAAFGYGLKTLQRIMRFQAFFKLAAHSGDKQLVELALQAGFADQSHLAREVQRLSGLTAGQFMAQIGV